MAEWATPRVKPRAKGFSALRRRAHRDAADAKIAAIAGYVERSRGGEAGWRFEAANP